MNNDDFEQRLSSFFSGNREVLAALAHPPSSRSMWPRDGAPDAIPNIEFPFTVHRVGELVETKSTNGTQFIPMHKLRIPYYNSDYWAYLTVRS